MTALSATVRSCSDEELAASSKECDSQAFTALVARHRAAIYGLALRLLGDPEEADEAAQEAFVRAFQLLAGYDPCGSFLAWLRGVAANVCCEMRRSRQRSPTAEQRWYEAAPAADDKEARDIALMVRQALDALPEKVRIPLALFYLDGASVRDVADALALSPGAVRVRLHRGRAILREKLSFLMEEGI